MTNADRFKHWPEHVKPLGQAGLDYVGIDRRTNELFWDGQKLVTERRLNRFERILATFAVIFTAIGAIATCVQAWFAANPPAA